jgi:hypothetical protein
MDKDSTKYAVTGGWGFAQFKHGVPVDDATLAPCFGCHWKSPLHPSPESLGCERQESGLIWQFIDLGGHDGVFDGLSFCTPRKATTGKNRSFSHRRISSAGAR